MSDNLEVAKECGLFPDGDIPAEPVVRFVDYQGLKESLEEYTSRILASQQAAHDAEIAKLKEELESERRICTEYIEQRNDALAACAMKDEALETCVITENFHYTFDADKVDEAISASTQQVSEWERKQLEPLRAQVAMLRSAVEQDAKTYNIPLTAKLCEALSNTQATAEQFIAECEQRGAVKALQVYKEKYRCVFHKSGPYLGQAIADLVDKEIAELRKQLEESKVPEDVVNDAKRWKWYRDNGNHTCGAMQLEAWVDLHLSAQAKESKE